jgi:plastocyanin
MTTTQRPRGRWTKLAIGLAAAAFALALVGIHDELAAAGPTAQASATKTVDINHFAYHPGTLTIARGTAVDFANSSEIAHTATGHGFDTGHIKPGSSIVVRFNQPGTFVYHCTIHPFMHGKVVVR